MRHLLKYLLDGSNEVGWYSLAFYGGINGVYSCCDLFLDMLIGNYCVVRSNWSGDENYYKLYSIPEFIFWFIL